jgi:hypothetical protein
MDFGLWILYFFFSKTIEIKTWTQMTFTTIENNSQTAHVCIFLNSELFVNKHCTLTKMIWMKLRATFLDSKNKLFISLWLSQQYFCYQHVITFLCVYRIEPPENVILFLLPPFLVIVCFTNNVFFSMARRWAFALLSLLR